MTEATAEFTYKKIFHFWLPLAATWIMMSVEGPLLTALIARAAEPKFNLAAYGVAYSLALIVEAPIIMMMSASIALVKDPLSFKKLRNFTYTANGIITLIMLLLVTPPVFYFIAETLIRLPAEVSRLTHTAIIILIPWPGAIGYRRFYQGLLIKNNLTKRVAHGTIIRLLSMLVCAFVLYFSGIFEGVIIGAASLSFAVLMEALAIRFMVRGTVDKIKNNISSSTQLTYKEIIRFYYPLALTSLIGLGVQPLVTFFVGQSKMSLESLAVLPVITSFVFIFRALGLSYQEVIIALLDEKKKELKRLLIFAGILASILVIILSLFAFTPLAEFWFITVSGLNPELAEFARLPLMIMFFFPALTVLISIQRGLLVSDKNTKPITLGTIIEFGTIVMALIILINFLDLIGAIAATIGFVAGRLAANFYLIKPSFSSLKKYVTERAIEP